MQSMVLPAARLKGVVLWTQAGRDGTCCQQAVRSHWLHQAADLRCCWQQDEGVLLWTQEAWDGGCRLYKRYSHTGCTKYAAYGVAGSNKRAFCSGHKGEGMVNFARKRCTHTGCREFAVYGVAGSKGKESCPGHRRDGMVNLSRPKSLPSDGPSRGEKRDRGASALEDGGAIGRASVGDSQRGNHSSSSTLAETSSGSSRKASKRVSRAPANMPAVSAPGGKSPTASEDVPLPESGAAVVKTETRLFEGTPHGSSQSRKSRSNGSCRRT